MLVIMILKFGIIQLPVFRLYMSRRTTNLRAQLMPNIDICVMWNFKYFDKRVMFHLEVDSHFIAWKRLKNIFSSLPASTHENSLAKFLEIYTFIYLFYLLLSVSIFWTCLFNDKKQKWFDDHWKKKLRNENLEW